MIVVSSANFTTESSPCEGGVIANPNCLGYFCEKVQYPVAEYGAQAQMLSLPISFNSVFTQLELEEVETASSVDLFVLNANW